MSDQVLEIRNRPTARDNLLIKLVQQSMSDQDLPSGCWPQAHTCPRCNQAVGTKNSNEIVFRSIPVEGIGEVVQMRCVPCDMCVALKVDGKLLSPHEVLVDKLDKNGWIQVSTPRDILVLYILNQILHREQDLVLGETVFDMPDPTDIAVLCWDKGQAIGFYTVKPEGTEVDGKMERYSMHTLDTSYIRASHRRHGHGLNLLQDLTCRYLGQDIGFSKPISFAMWQVLRKYLQENSALQDKLWEVDGVGGEGDRKLIWYSIKAQGKKRKRKSYSEEFHED